MNKQEIRNALYQGPATRLLSRLVKSQEFDKATGHAFSKEKRMKDRYLLTRFIGFYLYREKVLRDDQGDAYIYRDDIDELLGKAMDALNDMGENKVEQIEKLVLEALEKTYFYLGEDAFRLTGGERKNPINMNVFETLMYAIQLIPLEKIDNKQLIKNKITEFLNSSEFRENIGNHRDSAGKVQWRLDEAEKIGKALGKND